MVQPQTLVARLCCLSPFRATVSSPAVIGRQLRAVRCMSLTQVLLDLPLFKSPKLRDAEGGQSGKQYQLTTTDSAADTFTPLCYPKPSRDIALL